MDFGNKEVKLPDSIPSPNDTNAEKTFQELNQWNGDMDGFFDHEGEIVGEPGVPSNEANKFYDPPNQKDSTLP